MSAKSELEDKIENSIVTACESFRIDKNFMKAIIQVESGGRLFVTRYEPKTEKYCFDVAGYASANGMNQISEQVAQMTSYGLGQIMGFNFRSMGFKEPLCMACLPEINTYYMGKMLRLLFDHYGDETDVISSYNQGSPRKTKSGFYENQRYVDKVFAELLKLRGLEH